MTTTNPFDLSGRTALVTGASRGIGEACARALDAAGARVCLAARTTEAMEKVAADLANGAVVIESDLSARGSGKELAARAIDEFGRIDILVNNAAWRPTARAGGSATTRSTACSTSTCARP